MPYLSKDATKSGVRDGNINRYQYYDILFVSYNSLLHDMGEGRVAYATLRMPYFVILYTAQESSIPIPASLAWV